MSVPHHAPLHIASIRLHPLEVPMARPIKMAGETLTHAHTLLVQVNDETGRSGWGEASAAPLMTGETLASLDASAQYLASRLPGATVAGPAAIGPLLDGLLYGNPSAKSCLETALLDLLAQRAELPLHRLLAGPQAPAGVQRIEMLHMLAGASLEAELDDAQAVRAQGVRHWKIKVGAGPLESDLERVRRLCEALRGDVVSADANQSLGTEAAHAIARAGREGGMAFLEQPFRAGEVDAMVALHRASGLALCADESIHGLPDIASHADAGAAQGASLKLIKLGGPLALLEAGRMCLARGLRVNLACKVAETTVSAAATAHAGFALPDIAWGFSMSNRYLAQDLCAQPLAAADGAITAGQLAGPGLGYAPEAHWLHEFASRSLAGHAF